jgi:hypothetical protein
MKTRDVLRWNLSAGDVLQLCRIAALSLVMRALGHASDRVEQWIDLT